MAFLKMRLFECVTLDYKLLPVNQPFVDWLRRERAQGRRLILATAANQQLAEEAVAHLMLFDDVIGSDNERNLKGSAKAAALLELCGPSFAYAGNSSADFAVWKESQEAIVVDAPPRVKEHAHRVARVARVFQGPGNGLRSLIRSLRPYQWVKNLLVFVPAFTSHTVIHEAILLRSVIAFVAFCLCASGTYVVNDLLDLQEDRAHPTKKLRPLAAGEVSIGVGIFIATFCFISGMGVALSSGRVLPALLLLYIGLTLVYSARIKRLFLVDVLTLAILYTLRIIAGHVVADIPFSVWLLSFAFFLFLSLALCKRSTELLKLCAGQESRDTGRGYRPVDIQIISAAGLCSGFISSLVFALYINSETVTLLYRHPAVLWAILPLLLYYIARIWIVCGRGELDDDPILYTARTPSTYYIAALVVVIVIAATINF
jgi:4-hydroxybenzoate polyprenyltransferase